MTVGHLTASALVTLRIIELEEAYERCAADITITSWMILDLLGELHDGQRIYPSQFDQRHRAALALMNGTADMWMHLRQTDSRILTLYGTFAHDTASHYLAAHDARRQQLEPTEEDT